MPTLNRFPLLGLWAKEAARRLGYRERDAEALGHAYAVLYAIRARGKPREAPPPKAKHRPSRQVPPSEEVEFGGDPVPVRHAGDSRLEALVGGEHPQTARTYHASVENKFPGDYYDRLEKAFRQLLRAYAPRRMKTRLVYNLYDEWKRRCAVGRRVDLDELLEWCHEQSAALS